MNSLQIKYFLTAARCLNFTEAANQLYISQPALSQQISALENELNMQLFIRSKRKLYLTPAATVLLRELPKYEKHYADILEKARFANEGNSGILKIGFMEGQNIAPEVLKKLIRFREEHPNVAIDATCQTLSELRRMLSEDELDLIYTVDFEVEDNPSCVYQKVAKDHAVLLISKYSPLADREIHTLSDLKNETFLFLRGGDGEYVNELILQDCIGAGFQPNIRYVQSLDENILLAELGLGICIANSDSYGRRNPNIKELKNIKLANRHFVFAWKKDNINAVLALFVNYFAK